MPLLRWLFVVVMGLVLGGCSGVRQTVGGWFGGSAGEAREGDVYYAAAPGLAVHAEASGSSQILGRLNQYEKVSRTRLERGYAYISSQSRALEGWVDNAQLIWRLPARKAGVSPQSKPPAPSAAPEPAAVQESAPQAAGSAETAPAQDVPSSAAGEPTPQSKPAKARPEMFNPF